jgi:hypothetical protein
LATLVARRLSNITRAWLGASRIVLVMVQALPPALATMSRTTASQDAGTTALLALGA